MNQRNEAHSATPPSGHQTVRLRCGFCDSLVAAHEGVAGKLFICFGCVDVINQLRAESPGTSGQ